MLYSQMTKKKKKMDKRRVDTLLNQPQSGDEAWKSPAEYSPGGLGDILGGQTDLFSNIEKCCWAGELYVHLNAFFMISRFVEPKLVYPKFFLAL